ncbi:MAG: hypothetical protein J7647_01595 [Cyanobacteria bacterium SBLK]|nr:hypothetical protein [Cyanobacteria bacterium SBLK]
MVDTAVTPTTDTPTPTTEDETCGALHDYLLGDDTSEYRLSIQSRDAESVAAVLSPFNADGETVDVIITPDGINILAD